MVSNYRHIICITITQPTSKSIWPSVLMHHQLKVSFLGTPIDQIHNQRTKMQDYPCHLCTDIPLRMEELSYELVTRMGMIAKTSKRYIVQQLPELCRCELGASVLVRCTSIHYLCFKYLLTLTTVPDTAIKSNLAYVFGLSQQIIISPTKFCRLPSHHEEVPEIFYGKPSSIATGTILTKSRLDHRSLFLLAR